MLPMAQQPQPHYSGCSSLRDIAFLLVTGGHVRVEIACGRVSVITVSVYIVGVKDHLSRQFKLFRVQSNVELTSPVGPEVNARFAQALKKNKVFEKSLKTQK